jgi:hypothetical protein
MEGITIILMQKYAFFHIYQRFPSPMRHFADALLLPIARGMSLCKALGENLQGV